MANELNSSMLENLLEWDGNLTDDTAEIEFERKGFTLKVVCRSISSDEQSSIEKSSMQRQRGAGGIEETLDTDLFALKQIYLSVTTPDLTDAKLQEKFNPGGRQPWNIVDKIFKPGEKIQLNALISRLSGFTGPDTMESIENLLEAQREELSLD